jgi:hypothetical protein
MGVFIHAFEFSFCGSMVNKNAEILNFVECFNLKNDVEIINKKSKLQINLFQ